MIYLDAAATTKVKEEVIEAMMPYFTDKWHNPSALYSRAEKIKKDIEYARKTIGNFINANSDEVFFTSGGSESNCWAIQGFVNYCNRKGRKATIITSVIEHKSIIACVDNINADVHYIRVDREGFIDTTILETMLRHVHHKEENEILVSVQFANNEIGTIQHIGDIARLVHRYNALFHTDAVQAFGKIPINVKELGIDMLSASGHKIGSPKGIGILYKNYLTNIDPLIYGSQMNGMRGGTENVPYIMGMAKAVELIQNDKERQLRLTILRNNFISQLKTLGCKVNGSLNHRLPNNINVIFSHNITGEALLYLLDMADISVSTGSACDSRSIEPSHVLKAIGLTNEDAARTIRITFPDDITQEDIDKVICELEKQIKLLSMEEQND